MNSITKTLVSLFAVAMFLVACSQPDDGEVAAPDNYKTPAVSSGDRPLQSVDANGKVAPFGMASRQPVSVPDAPAAAVAAVTGAADPGAALFAVQCVACHGANAQGVTGLGVNLVESKLVSGSSSDELVAFLKAGRAADAPDSTTKVPMPAFAWMSAGDLTALAGYLKTL